MTTATNSPTTIADTMRQCIEASIPQCQARVSGDGGHFTIEAASPEFVGKSRLESQRLVYSAISHLMRGDGAPVHAIDSLKTRAPA
jgi:acid stress-induced BolA-like protein IbaG/YrbA